MYVVCDARSPDVWVAVRAPQVVEGDGDVVRGVVGGDGGRGERPAEPRPGVEADVGVEHEVVGGLVDALRLEAVVTEDVGR